MKAWAEKGRGWMRRVGLARVGCYAALALLLTGLGLGSRAYRSRAAERLKGAETPRAVMAQATEDPLSALVRLTPTPTPTAPPLSFVWPLEGEIVGPHVEARMAWSETLRQWQTHPALDIAAQAGEAVCACAEGTVSAAWRDALWGNVVEIEHPDGYVSTYANLGTLNLAAVGAHVEAGQAIGTVGSTAACEAELPCHLHFEIKKWGETVKFEDCMSNVIS